MKKLLTFSVILVVLISLPLNSQWINQNSGTTKSLFCPYPYNADNVFISGDSSILIKTVNGGTNWTIMPPPGAGNNYYAGMYMQNLNNIYLAQGYTGGISGLGKILYSTNGGYNWSTQLTTQYDMFSIAFINSTTGYAVGNGSVSGNDSLYKTTNGSAWFPVSVTNIGFMTYVYFYNASTGFICAVGSDYILRTSNSGINWSVVSTNAGQDRINQIVMVDANTCYGVSDSGTFIKSNNGGVNWTRQTFGTLHGASLAFTSVSTGFIVAGKESTQQYQILKTTNAGSNWTTVMSGTGKLYWAIAFVNSNTGWIVGEKGSILKTTNGGGVWVKNISKEMPDKYCLYQNYPNPFNPATNIKYQIKNNDFVTLKIFDAVGRVISTLVNEVQKAGTYEATFDATDLSSGIYFYRLTAGDFNKTVKMIFVK